MTDAASGVPAPDSRPRPQYGEYATPEEQRARIRQAGATDALSAGQAPDEAQAPAASPVAAAPGEEATATAAAPAMTRGRLIDRAVTFGLLGYGLYNVVVSASQLLSFERFADSYFAMAGIEGAFTNLDQGRLWGTIAAVVLFLGWVGTAWSAWRSLRRGRISFWIPIAGVVGSGILVGLLLCVPLFGDPAFIDWVTRFG